MTPSPSIDNTRADDKKYQKPSLLQRLNIRGRLTTQNTGELRVTPEQGEYSDGATSC